MALETREETTAGTGRLAMGTNGMGGVDDRPRGGWLRVTAPLWPLGLARLLYGVLWWQQSGWKVPADDFGRKSG
ncbi:MAG: hypothetical protein HY511_02280, partial [Actinobacteria bacterium]|nr:hypothetical protein [Actinomycetota bacterium]